MALSPKDQLRTAAAVQQIAQEGQRLAEIERHLDDIARHEGNQVEVLKAIEAQLARIADALEGIPDDGAGG